MIAYRAELESMVARLEEENEQLMKEMEEQKRKRLKQLMDNVIPVLEKRRPPGLRRIQSMQAWLLFDGRRSNDGTRTISSKPRWKNIVVQPICMEQSGECTILESPAGDTQIDRLFMLRETSKRLQILSCSYLTGLRDFFLAYMDEEDLNAGEINYMWTHALISDETHSRIIKYCNFSPEAKSTRPCRDSLNTAFNEIDP